MIETRAYARAGLLGNPSDGYFGKVIAITLKNFAARISACESSALRIEPPSQDADTFKDAQDFVERTNLYGYYGGTRLIKATLKIFFDYCRRKNINLKDKNVALSWDSTIPRQVGLGGSSAIIVATLRALMTFYAVEIPLVLQPTLALQAELEELGINAGFMDRVVQVYEGCVFMDLDRRQIEEKGYGVYERLEPERLPPLYLAYKQELGKVSGFVLSDIRAAYDRGDKSVHSTLKRIAELAAEGKQAFGDGDFRRWPALMNENFDLRSRIMRINPSNMEMIQTARRCGAAAKFAGSGGSIIGIYEGEEMYQDLVRELRKIRAKVMKPQIV